MFFSNDEFVGNRFRPFHYGKVKLGFCSNPFYGMKFDILHSFSECLHLYL
ncbi:hypothetical protein LEP1GSC050_1719 [Leptospira broomii serovar Hurstbridge str. 5399]|uniref:Uncharacterized protein n=1 Tax=Leptospira broomii serovar Hurstbridge str. 5399 TaxID=1049789 RepID=T0GD42_9LEPT|nr:hypothetical protein LEP1GSC050_1719 [Leptospira broomii serovar Hurstbridge str. 5399]